LGSSTRRSRDDRHPQLASDLHGAIPAATVADHDLVGKVDNWGEMSSKRLLLIESWNDNGNTQAGQIGEMLA
jgi:hypothetical protein